MRQQRFPKGLFLTIVLTYVAICSWAQPISEQEALARATRYLANSTALSNNRRSQLQGNPMKVAMAEVQHLYAFNYEGGGFIITSADQRALPVLGYSTDGAVDWEQMPANMKVWLQQYNEAINWLEHTGYSPSVTDEQSWQATPHRAAIQPLIQTSWGQDPVYNNLCPTYNGKYEPAQGKLCVTGCVATSMAQVMNYHRWPEAATTEIPAYSYTVSNVNPDDTSGEEFSVEALPPVTFDWSNMRPHYLFPIESTETTTDAEKEAVATLMRYCGQGVKMVYSPTTSLAMSVDAAYALRTYFGYDKGTRMVSRIGYSIADWEQLVYSELAASRPVIYAGQSDDGGHSFICDGYDGNGLFHINWGWEGQAEGYFSLSVLNPYAVAMPGIAYPGVGFSMSQDIIIGIQPPTDGTTAASTVPELKCHKHLAVNKDGDNYLLDIAFYYMSVEYPEATFQVSLFLETATGYQELAVGGEAPVPSGYPASLTFTVNAEPPASMPDGTYRLYPHYRCTSVDGADWQMLTDKDMYFELTIKDGICSYRAMPSTDNLTVNKWEITKGDGTEGTASDVTLTVQNNGTEYQGTLLLIPVFIGDADGEAAWQAISSASGPVDNMYPTEDIMPVGAYLEAHASSQVTFSFKPHRSGGYLLCLTEDPANSLRIGTPFAHSAITIGAPTDISRLQSSKGVHATCYDMKGLRMDAHQLPKGIYVNGGKKFIVK